ncbi:GNAT family N-acetyltransferase [Halobacillus locisalis]|uniref:GNAT family N-acetyltransferase n=1 Tax=Halobacillus locisalis TaxID=220753 RepID=A0A838CSX7_9BACI|nr:GNAT family N-acetyltransferase [Halobacillus locisalis]MBA2175177.1 GNAT family N-acetyltransferase [Halobacillus locisalis]
MNQEEAEIVADWTYPEPYQFYDMKADEEDYEEFISPEQRNPHTYSVYEGDALIGFFTFTPVEGEVDIGLGMRPVDTGHGKGQVFIERGLQFAEEMYAPKAFTLSVAQFNTRAISVYEKIGFVKVREFMQPTNGDVYPFIQMKKS